MVEKKRILVIEDDFCHTREAKRFFLDHLKEVEVDYASDYRQASKMQKRK